MPYLEYGKIDKKTEQRLQTLLRKNFRKYWRKKRTFDVIVTAILLVILFVPMLLVALIIFIDDPHGSPLYKQVRIGRHGKSLRCSSSAPCIRTPTSAARS